MADMEIAGTEQIDALVRRIREHADRSALQRELNAGLNSVTKLTRGELTEAIPAALPRHGGLAAEIQRATKFNTSAKSGAWAGVTVWGKAKGHDLRTLTGRRLRHPVWGNRSVWVNQTKGVNPAAFLAKWDDQKPDVQRAISDVLEQVARRIVGGA